jgi:hypothetical protein
MAYSPENALPPAISLFFIFPRMAGSRQYRQGRPADEAILNQGGLFRKMSGRAGHGKAMGTKGRPRQIGGEK